MSSVRSSRAIAAMLVVAVAISTLAGCARGHPALDGTQWRLTEWTLSSLNPRDLDITAGFADGKMSGHSGVNSYGGRYTVDARRSFKVESIASTEMTGSGVGDARRGRVPHAARAGAFVSSGGGAIELFDAGGNESLIFEAAGR